MSLAGRIARTTLTLAALLAGLLAATGAATAEDRSLTLYHTHTRESATITFKRNGRYDAQGLTALNTFLRDWRTNEPTQMDPALFDLLWAVYGDVGASQPINIVSSYRSPKTNAALRANSSGVAENSQHIRGKAMDFFIPGVNLATLRAAAMRRQGGGVGYYPTSGSPFVHLDTGSVRAWPRMTTAQLMQVFPDGKTAHLPSDGGPLPGYKVATASLAAPQPVPVIAAAPKPNLFERLFGGKEEAAPVAPAPQPVVPVADERLEPTTGIEFAGVVTTVARVSPVVPPRRPDSQASAVMAIAAVAPVPAPRPERFGSAVAVAEAPEVEVIHGDYALLGYSQTRQALVDADPFAFLLDLKPVAAVSSVMSAASAAPASPPAVVALSGVDPALHAPSLMSDRVFAEFTPPSGQDIPFMLAAPDTRLAGHFAASSGPAPRRF